MRHESNVNLLFFGVIDKLTYILQNLHVISKSILFMTFNIFTELIENYINSAISITFKCSVNLPVQSHGIINCHWHKFTAGSKFRMYLFKNIESLFLHFLKFTHKLFYSSAIFSNNLLKAFINLFKVFLPFSYNFQSLAIIAFRCHIHKIIFS